MKPITNILLVLALICYVFLPFYEISFQGSLTGFSFTAGTITQRFSVGNTLFALIPFLACFLGVVFNSFKHRRWALASIVCIIVALYFMVRTGHYHDYALTHAPDVIPAEDLGEGFSIQNLGVGYSATLVMLVLAFISSIISLMPFKFNERIEHAVDHTFDDTLEDVRAFGARVSHEVKHHHKNK